MTHFKVGERVRIKKDANISDDGKKYREEIATITKCTLQNSINGKYSYSIDIGSGGVWESELEPVTKSLDELEVGDKVSNGCFVHEIGAIRKCYHLTNTKSKDGVLNFRDVPFPWTVEQLENNGYTYYTPKKIKVFKHKGKSYPIEEIIKKVKSL